MSQIKKWETHARCVSVGHYVFGNVYHFTFWLQCTNMNQSSHGRTSIFVLEFNFQYVRGDVWIHIATQNITLTFLLKWHFDWQCKYGKSSLTFGTERLFELLPCMHGSGAANDHVAAFFQDRPIFAFSDNLGYSLLKHARYPNLWPPCEGTWSNSVLLSFMGKYSSRGLVFFTYDLYLLNCLR